MRTPQSSSTGRASVRPALTLFSALLLLAASAIASDVAKNDPNQTPATESVIYNFTTNYSNPSASLTTDTAGNLYGTAFDGTKFPDGAVFELSQVNGAWKEKPLIIFDGKNGAYPSAMMVFDGQGNLYGSTVEGGDGPCAGGCGVIFELSPSGATWNYTILYSFQNGVDGEGPGGNLLIDPSGNLYGTTSVGQTTNGTVFELKHPAQQGDSWTHDTLFTFNGTDGFSPNALAFSGGALYGTTAEGGSSNYTGSVFQLKPSNGTWSYTLVYAFSGGADGAFPLDIVASGIPNVLYGTAQSGGQSNYGVIFEISPNSSGSWSESVLYNFTGGADGAQPISLIAAGPDKIFGTTNSGGDASACSFLYPSLGCGVVYEFVLSTATETVLHAFTGPPSDGAGTYGAGVILDQGALYGATYYGGNGQCSNGTEVVGCGTVYKVTP